MSGFKYTPMQMITKPCEGCGYPTKDKNDPEFKDAWLCYSCHCDRTGLDKKKALNDSITLMKEAIYTFKRIQWQGNYDRCPECVNKEGQGHEPDCLIDMFANQSEPDEH